MLSRTSFLLKPSKLSLSQRIARISPVGAYHFEGKVKQCGTRLVYHVAKQDPHLSLLPATALVNTVNTSLNIVSSNVSKKSITQPMMREILSRSDEKISSVNQDLNYFSESNDRNISFMVANRKRVQLLHEDDAAEEEELLMMNNGKSSSKQAKLAQKRSKLREEREMLEEEALEKDYAIGKFGCFYDLLIRNWNVCRDIRPLEKRIAVIFNLISKNGYREAYTDAEIKAAMKTVSSKSVRYLRTFKYDKHREFYARRRLLTDGALHNIVSSGEAHHLRKVAWILFFDATFQRFPRRPKKNPSHDLYELWHAWSDSPVARSLPFMERFVALLSHPDLDKMLQYASLSSDSKARQRIKKQDALLAHRNATVKPVPEDVYNARKEIKRQKLTLNEVAWKLHRERELSFELSALPTYLAVMETSAKYRSATCAKELARNMVECSDEDFSYDQAEL